MGDAGGGEGAVLGDVGGEGVDDGGGGDGVGGPAGQEGGGFGSTAECR